jgi:hypothetical protein
MLITARILTGLLALIALGTGLKGSLSGLEITEAAPIVDNTFRYYAGVWAGVGVGLAYCVAYMPSATELLRFLMLAIFIGGVARAIGLSTYEVFERKIVVGIVIETVVPLLVIGLQYAATSASN